MLQQNTIFKHHHFRQQFTLEPRGSNPPFSGNEAWPEDFPWHLTLNYNYIICKKQSCTFLNRTLLTVAELWDPLMDGMNRIGGKGQPWKYNWTGQWFWMLIIRIQLSLFLYQGKIACINGYNTPYTLKTHERHRLSPAPQSKSPRFDD